MKKSEHVEFTLELNHSTIFVSTLFASSSVPWSLITLKISSLQCDSGSSLEQEDFVIERMVGLLHVSKMQIYP
ncbi:hypothetical protein P8452_39933 [Trifolium repens]|nr:hypothetical protein P8452_39933 [Trifolium repens]